MKSRFWTFILSGGVLCFAAALSEIVIAADSESNDSKTATVGGEQFAFSGSVVSRRADGTSNALDYDEATGTFLFTENGKPTLNYHFGPVPLPNGVEIHHFSVGPTAYDGAYFSDGSAFGGERSDYIQPIFGFNGEALTEDFPRDHLHHRGCWLSFCEVRWNEKLGDLWAVCKIRAYPKRVTKLECDGDQTTLQVVNVWRYDDDPTEIVEETLTISTSRTSGDEGKKSRTIDVVAELKALVDGVSIAGRQKVDYGGYGGIAVRMNPDASDFSFRVVHPKPDQWNGVENEMAERIVDPTRFGEAAWIAIYGKYPIDETANSESVQNAADGSTTLAMFESKANPLYPNQFRYYSSRNAMIAFPGFETFSLPKDETVRYQTRFWLRQGKTSLDDEKQVWNEFQKTIR